MNANPYTQGVDKIKKKNAEFDQNAKALGSGLKSAFGSAFAIIGGGITVIEGVKKTISATQGTADSFEMTMSGLGTATDKFFKILSTGDWDNFLTKLKQANEAGREYAGIMDELGDRQRSQDIFSAEQQQKLSGFEEIFRDTGLPPEVRQKALNDYKALKLDLLAAQRQINQETLDAEQNKYATLSGLDKQYIDYVITNYDKEINKIRDANENISKYKELQKAAQPITTVNSFGVASTFVDENAQKKVSEFWNGLSADQQMWFKRMQAYNNLNDAELDKIKAAKLNLIAVDNESAGLNVTLIKQQNSINNAIQGEVDAVKKVTEERNKQLQTLDEYFNQVEKDVAYKAPNKPESMPEELKVAEHTLGIGDSYINTDFVEGYSDDMDKVIDKNKDVEKSFDALAAANSIVGDSFVQMAEDGKISMGEITAFIMQSIMKIIIGKMAETSAYIASDSVKKMGWAGLALAGVGIGLVSSMFSGIMSDAGNFTDSGIVGGTSYFGDKMIAHVNSGEAFYSRGDQQALFNIIKSGGAGGGQVEFILRGDRLEGVTNNSKRARKSYQGNFSNRRN
jgi:hypothetical protein